MKAADYREQQTEVAGWQVKVTSYKLEDGWHAVADNVSPGANIAKASGTSREEAEEKCLAKARERLAQTKRHAV